MLPPIPQWDPDFGKYVTPEDKITAETAYIDFLTNPMAMAGCYVDPGGSCSLEYSALDMFAQYSTLHTTADQVVWNTIAQLYGMDAAEQLSAARTQNIMAAFTPTSDSSNAVVSSAIVGGGSYASAWFKATFESAEASAQWHFLKHGGGWSSIEEYTQAARNFYATNVDLAKFWPINNSTEMGVKITANGYYGIYNLDGQIVSFGRR